MWGLGQQTEANGEKDKGEMPTEGDGALPLTKVNVSKGPTPYFPSQSVLVPHSQIHGVESSLWTQNRRGHDVTRQP